MLSSWADRSRRFVWARSASLSGGGSPELQDRERFKTLVDRGQLEFIGGGWVQNDEARHFDVINQVSEGTRFA